MRNSGFIILTAFLSACAHQSLSMPSVAVTNAGEPVTLTATQPKRVSLPYTFMRHGVEIRVNSVEVSENQLKASVTVQETRGVAIDLLTSNLMEVKTSGENVIPYLQYIRDENIETSGSIHLPPKNQATIDLIYQAPSGLPEGSPFTLEFPTGKRWSSQTVDSR